VFAEQINVQVGEGDEEEWGERQVSGKCGLFLFSESRHLRLSSKVPANCIVGDSKRQDAPYLRDQSAETCCSLRLQYRHSPKLRHLFTRQVCLRNISSSTSLLVTAADTPFFRFFHLLSATSPTEPRIVNGAANSGVSHGLLLGQWPGTGR